MGMSNTIKIIVGWPFDEIEHAMGDGGDAEDVFDDHCGGFDGDNDEAVAGVAIATGGGYKNFAGHKELSRTYARDIEAARQKAVGLALDAGLRLPEPRLYLAWSCY